jgi:hypothetical protein
MAKQPLAWTGHLETITSLRAKGAVRGITPATK